VSNAVFDTSLRENNPEWGVRDIADLEKLAAANGLRLAETFEMPANNMILMFVRPRIRSTSPRRGEVAAKRRVRGL
jgi:hypothetical protein